MFRAKKDWEECETSKQGTLLVIPLFVNKGRKLLGKKEWTVDFGTSTLCFLIERKVGFLLCRESGFTITYGILSTKIINFGVQLTHNNTASPYWA